MRIVQLIGLFGGVIAFAVSAMHVGSEAGDIWWRVGVAILLTDIVLILLAGPRQPKV
jgi:hypothetical protein